MPWEVATYPFFGETHRQLVHRLRAFADRHAALLDAPHPDLGATARVLVRALGEAGLLAHAIPGEPGDRVDVRTICLIREGLAYRSALADNMFVMQGIGTAAMWDHPDAGLRARYVLPARAGTTVCALALTEREIGSDIAATSTEARRVPDGFVIEGEKSWITNAPIADQYIVVARTGERPGAKGLSAFIVDRDTPGLIPGGQVDNIGDHPLGTVRFEQCFVPESARITAAGAGFAAMMETFDIFRISVAAAALGCARRALDEAVARVRSRTLYGQPMARMGAIEQRIAEMAADTETAALHCYQAAWLADTQGRPDQRASSLAKYVSTEAASRVVDGAVQIFGAQGIVSGHPVERLYRDVRPMRIYEGASEVQKMIVGRNVLRTKPAPGQA